MSRVPRPRRRLPRRVYWFRRLLVLGVVPGVLVASVVGLAQVLGGSSGDSPDVAVTVGSGTSASVTPTGTSATPSPAPTPATVGRYAGRSRDQGRKALPRPDGECRPDDVLVTPSLPDPRAYGPVTVVLELTTQRSPACTFDVDPQSVFVTISSGDQVLWSSQDCPAAIPTRTVVPRRDRAARVRLTWDGKESDPVCSKYGSWVAEGDYVASAVARGSVTPVDVAFKMLPGVAVQPTNTESATPTQGAEPSPSPTGKPSPSPTGKSSPAPSGKPGPSRTR